MPLDASVLRRNWLAGDLGPVLARNHFDGCVTVQATTNAREVEWLLSLADENAFVLGVVGWVDLTDRDLGHRLDELQRHPKFKGVRHPVHDEEDERWLLGLNVLNGLRELERRHIPFDLLVRPVHLPVVLQLAEHVPDLPMVIDHIAKPRITTGEMEPWAADIERVAQIPGVHVKISGMITEAEWKRWLPSQLAPYVQHVWKSFGPERCMFGSDWPVCLQAGIWKEVLAGFTQALGPVVKEVRAGVMGENAKRFYRLAVGAATT